MTTVFVDLVNLDGSRPEGSLWFSLERLVLGAPDVVPSAVDVKIRDGKARVENLLPGAMRVRVNAGCWSKDWHIEVPAEGEHDLLDLLEWQAEDFQETVWAELSKRVEALENTPAVDLAPLEQRVTELEQAPKVDLAPLEKRLGVLESRPEPEPFDPTGLEAADKKLGERLTVLEQKPAPEPFDPTALQAENQALKTQVEQLQAHLTPVELLDEEAIYEDIASIYDTGSEAQVIQHAGRVGIIISASDLEGLLRALDGLQLPHFPKVKAFQEGGLGLADVALYSGGKFVAKLQPQLVYLKVASMEDRTPIFEVAVDTALAVAQEVGANRMALTTYYYTNDLPPETDY